ncbi:MULTISPECIES: hypothetical protein [Pseudomonas]|uniref:hypothetical protein n=1 Tax=Pseudomonas TaxID=286 RepID=UPI001C0A7F99|nr:MULTISPECIES: hypothetical protein [Pseudomonas]MCK3838812.1 hypothetical protein [Pseudomonas sp. NCIMB 10586]VCU67923.1 hypothetical protein [Pseudomonas synxantha]
MKKRSHLQMLGFFAAIYSASSTATGILKLSSNELSLLPGHPAGELFAENVGDTPLYLQVDQALLTNPGELPERLVPISQVKKPSLLVTPNRITIAPGQRYKLNIKIIQQVEQDHIWRITFRPSEHLVVEGEPTKNATPIFFKVGYGAVIYQKKRPKELVTTRQNIEATD